MASHILDAHGQPAILEDPASSPAVQDADKLMAILTDLVAEEVGLRMAMAEHDPNVSNAGLTSEDDLSLDSRTEMIRASRRAYYRNPIARNAVESLRLFIAGGGFTVRAVDEAPSTQLFLNEFIERNWLLNRTNELIRRTFRDGEAYIREIVKDGLTSLRWMDALRCVGRMDDPGDSRSFDVAMRSGVVTDPDDIETVLHYWFDTSGDNMADTKFPAEEIRHVKLFSDSDMLHGRPLLEPVLRRLSQYEQWVDQRAILNRLKTAVYLIRTVSGTAGAVSALVDKTIMSTRSGRSGMSKLPPPATLLTATDNIKYEFTSPNLDARDVAEDGRKLVLDVAAGLGMPVPLLTGDISETTYAGLLVAESPFVRRAQDMQLFFGEHVAGICQDAIQAGIDGGKLSADSHETSMTEAARAELELWEQQLRDSVGDERRAPRARSEIARIKSLPASYAQREVPRKTKVQIVWPEIVHRDFEKLLKGLEIMDRISLASKRTMAAMAGLDAEEERRQIMNERVPDDEAELRGLDSEIETAEGEPNE